VLIEGASPSCFGRSVASSGEPKFPFKNLVLCLKKLAFCSPRKCYTCTETCCRLFFNIILIKTVNKYGFMNDEL
jgi:hypothetical protein